MRVHDDEGDLNEMGGGDEDEEDDERAMADAVGHMLQAARRSLGIQGAAPHSAINGNHGQLTAPEHIMCITLHPRVQGRPALHPGSYTPHPK